MCSIYIVHVQVSQFATREEGAKSISTYIFNTNTHTGLIIISTGDINDYIIEPILFLNC